MFFDLFEATFWRISLLYSAMDAKHHLQHLPLTVIVRKKKKIFSYEQIYILFMFYLLK